MRHRRVVASLASPLVALAPFLLLGVTEANSPSVFANGEPDDAPLRAFGAFIVMLPASYVCLSVVSALVGNALATIGLRSAKQFLAASAALSVVAGAALGLLLGSSGEFFTSRTAITVLALAAASLLCIAPAAATWWAIALRKVSDA